MNHRITTTELATGLPEGQRSPSGRPVPTAVPNDDHARVFLDEIAAIRRQATEDSPPPPLPRGLVELSALLADLDWPDDDFANDLERIQASQGRIGQPPPWPNYSTLASPSAWSGAVWAWVISPQLGWVVMR